MDFHPLSEDYPLMPAYELGRIEEAMRERGFDPRFPIVRYQKKILDGRNRWLAAEKAGVKPLFVDFKGTEDEARVFVQTANEERRHLATEWLHRRREERIGRVAAARQEGESIRTIAERENVSPAQVHADIEKATVQGLTVEPKGGKVTGKDGRKKPARTKSVPQPCDRCRRLGVPGCPACKEAFPQGFPAEANGTNERSTDAAGHAIPESCADAFAALAQFEEADSLCRSLQKLIDALVRVPGGEQLARLTRAQGDDKSVSHRLEELNTIKRHLKFTRPHSVCPWCKGKKAEKCKGCSGTGWVTKTTWDGASDAEKARLS